MQYTHTIIIGAGVTGLSASRLLKAKGHSTIILEKSNTPGGLIKCDRVEGHLFHRVGGHVFNSKNQSVTNWFWNQFNKEDEFFGAKRHASVFMNDLFLGYPFENNLYNLDANTIKAVINEIIDLEKSGYKSPDSYSNFEEFLKGNFGTTLYELYFRPYNHKIWKTDLSKVALPWLDGKLPMPNYREVILSNILRAEEQGMVHSSFFYPKQNGSQFIADRMAEGSNIITNSEVKRIEQLGDKWVVNGEYSADNIIYTGDIRCLDDLLASASSETRALLATLKNLKSNGTSNLLCETDEMPYSWLYLPESKISAHRIIYTGNFSNSNQPANGRKSCTVEFSGKTDIAVMEREIKHLPGNLKMISSNYEPNSYVIQQNGDREKINHLKEILAPTGFYLAGRFAEWEYHNMDKAIESAMGVVDKIIL